MLYKMNETGAGDLFNQIDLEEVMPLPKVDRTEETGRLLAGRELIPLGESEPEYRKLVFLEEAFQEMINYGVSDRSRELGGALFGYHDDAEGATIITRFVAASNARSNEGAINFGPDDWAQMHLHNDQANNTQGTDHRMVAWFHTHPHNYPPTPLTSYDRFIMKNIFPESKGPEDQTTIILTTGSERLLGAGSSNDNDTFLAGWKWDKDAGEAKLMNGITIATTPDQTSQSVKYFKPRLEAARVVKDTVVATIDIDLEDLEGLRESVENQIEIEDEPITIDIDVPGGNDIEIPDVLIDPENGTIEVNLDEITPERARRLIGFIQRNPSGRFHSIVKKVLEQAKKVLPPTIQNEINLVLLQTPSIAEQIEIEPANTIGDQIELLN